MRDIRTLFRSEPGLTSIDIGADSINTVRLLPPAGNDTSRPKITACIHQPYSNPEELRRALHDLSLELRLKYAKCTTLLPEQEYHLLLTDTPNVPEAELLTALRWQVKDLLNQPVDETTFETFPAPVTSDISSANSTYVLAAPNQAIQSHVDLLTGAGINLQTIDIQEMALRNIIMLTQEPDQVTALLWLRPDDGQLMIVCNGDIYMNRTISMGLDELGSEQDQLIDTLALEIQRSLDFYQSRYHLGPVRNLLLAPGLSNTFPQLRLTIISALNLETDELDFDDYLERPTEMPETWQQTFFITIGAALRHEVAA